MSPHDAFVRYLKAKRPVDDRSLDRRVWHALAAELARRDGSVDVLEVGAGSGAMIERLVGGGLIRRGRYVAVDRDTHVLADARRRLPPWAAQQGFDVVERSDAIELRTGDDEETVTVELVAADLLDAPPAACAAAASSAEGAGYDLLVAHAVLDLIDLDASLPRLLAALAPGGLCYFPITFDGGTYFEPRMEMDSRIETLYHETMERPAVAARRSGSSRTGRRLLTVLPAAGADILAVGASDWIVVPIADVLAGYPGDEAFFLRYLLGTIASALAGHSQIDPDRFVEWLRRRHEQVARGELVFIAHQLDVLGVVGRTAESNRPPRSDESLQTRPT